MMNRRRSILIAENDRAIAQWLKLHLERAGFSVYVAFDGEQAAILAARQRFELIIANYALPIFDGVELLRHVREDLHLLEIPIAICGDAKIIYELEATLEGDNFAQVFQKPVDPNAVVDFAREAVEYAVTTN